MRALLLSLLCCTVMSLGAQENKKYLLIEHFTNTYCPICAGRNPGIYSTLNKFDETEIHHFSIHPSVPYPQCPLYNFNKIANEFRQSLYVVRATPRLFINGNETSTTPASFENAIQSQLDQISPLSIVVEDGANRNQDINIIVKTHHQVAPGELRLFVALVEKYKMFQANNGERDHFNIYRRPISSFEGDPFSPAPPGSSITKSYTYAIPQGVAAEQAYVLAFVQNMDTKEILNSGASYDQVYTSVTEDEDGSVFRIYPNPVDREFFITTTDRDILDLRLYDLYGRLIKTFPVQAGSDHIILLADDLAPGVYALELEIKEGRFVKRIVKQ